MEGIDSTMKRRKFLKLIIYSPFMFLIPGVFAKMGFQSSRINLHDYNADGGYRVPKHIADKIIKEVYMQERVYQRKMIIKKFNIPKSILAKKK